MWFERTNAHYIEYVMESFAFPVQIDFFCIIWQQALSLNQKKMRTSLH